MKRNEKKSVVTFKVENFQIKKLIILLDISERSKLQTMIELIVPFTCCFPAFQVAVYGTVANN